MQHHWTRSTKKQLLKKDFNKDSLFNQISFLEDYSGTSTKRKILLLGAADGIMDAIRPILYQYAAHIPQNLLVDGGNIKQTDESSFKSLYSLALEHHFIPVIINSDTKPLELWLNQINSSQSSAQIAYFDEQLPGVPPNEASISDSWTMQVQNNPTHTLDLMAYQRHLVYEDKLAQSKQLARKLISLGELNNNIQLSEPILRETNVFSFNSCALKQSICLDHSNPNPSGLNLNQACQQIRYVGMNEHRQFIHIFGLSDDITPNQTAAHSLAQMIWYFLEGFVNSKADYPLKKSNLISYVVDIKHTKDHLTFWKSKNSGRWWVEFPGNSSNQPLIPCTKDDFETCASGEISDSLLDLF